MLFSLALILLVGILFGWICKKIRFPSLFGMILTGIILGPYVLNLIDDSVLSISPELRKIALIIILLRAGLTLNLKDLKKVGRPAILMCFIPACFEIIGMIWLAPKFLGVTVLEAAIIGAVVAAVSPAVIVPKMINLIEDKYGANKSIPQLILAGASVDDVFVIVIFTALTNLAKSGEALSVLNFVKVPLSIVLGIVVGFIVGKILAKFFEKVHIRDTIKVIIIMSISFILVTIEDVISAAIPFSGLIAIMALGIALNRNRKIVADRLSIKFNKLWVLAEVMLFVLVGATVNINYATTFGLSAIILILLVLVIRMIGVFCCMIKTNLNYKERLFCMISYLPKATVQASIGGIPLAMGLSCGDTVLTVAVLAILITAPLGAFLIDLTYKKLLENEN